MNRKVLIAGLVVAVPVLALLFLNLGRDPHRVRSPLVGKPAPSFALKEVGGDRVISLQSLQGKPVVVNFWATWCVPCYAEHRVLTSSAGALGSSVQFLGVAYQDSDENILRFLRQYGTAYPTVADEAGKTAIAYGVYGVPETFFVNPAGVIVAKHEGALTDETLRENLATASRAR